MTGGPVGVALVGAGNISKQYLDNMSTFPDLRIVAVTDRYPKVAKARAEAYGIELHGTPEVALDNPEVEVVVNLTIPAAHVEVGLAAIRAGKHVWSEKPLALDRVSGQELLAAADQAGVMLGCAPDTFLGAGLQSARRAIERGDIGTPLTALTLFQIPGPESWHPNPAFLYQRGAGPLFDMGPYYLTALVQTLGNVRRVNAVGSKSLAQRVVGSGPLAGEVFEVEVPTHVSMSLEFEGGESATSIFSFQSPRVRAGFVEVTGTEGVLSLPDPNGFGGPLKLHRQVDKDFAELPVTGPANGRGMGVLDMARSLRSGAQHRASGALGWHVLETMIAGAESIERLAPVAVESSAPKAAPIPEDWAPLEQTL